MQEWAQTALSSLFSVMLGLVGFMACQYLLGNLMPNFFVDFQTII